MKALLERFQSKYRVAENGCWIWTAGKRHGYGAFRLKVAGVWKTHKVSWFIHRGDTDNAFVLHECDTPACVNPEHLFLGTRKDNIRDMHAKGRYGRPRALGDRNIARRNPTIRQGERNGRSKLTAQDVREIRRDYEPGQVGYKTLGDRHGVHPSVIRGIVRGELWRSVSSS